MGTLSSNGCGDGDNKSKSDGDGDRITKEQNIGNYGYIGTLILRIYQNFDFTDISEISVDILTKISVKRKLINIL